MGRSDAGLSKGLAKIRALRSEFWENLRVLGQGEELESRVGKGRSRRRLHGTGGADGARRPVPQGIVRWSLPRRVPTEEGEALRDDANFCHVAAWEHTEEGGAMRWNLHQEPLSFEEVKLTQRSYK